MRPRKPIGDDHRIGDADRGSIEVQNWRIDLRRIGKVELDDGTGLTPKESSES
jgi:hypothetical protein